MSIYDVMWMTGAEYMMSGYNYHNNIYHHCQDDQQRVTRTARSMFILLYHSCTEQCGLLLFDIRYEIIWTVDNMYIYDYVVSYQMSFTEVGTKVNLVLKASNIGCTMCGGLKGR